MVQEAIEVFFHHWNHGGVDRRGFFVQQIARALHPFRAVGAGEISPPGAWETPNPSDDFKAGWLKAAKKVEDICSEFGDDPKSCMVILGEWFGQERHASAVPE